MRFRLPCACAVAVASFAGAAATAATAAATTTPPDSSPGSEPPEFDLQAPFWGEASAQCTQVLNNHLERPSGAFDVFIEIVEADAADEVPSAGTIAGWTETLTADIARSEAIRTELADFVVVDPTYAELWDTVVSAADEGVEVQRTRLAALESGGWDAIVAGIRATMGQGGGSSAEAFEAVDASPLRGTDCAAVHSWRMPADESVIPEFVTAVTEVCVIVANRRLGSTFGDDMTVSLNFLGALLAAGDDGDLEIPADLEGALGRLVDEWTVTVDDFAAIDPASAPSEAAWAAITGVPADRLAMFERRRDAVASGDVTAIREAYDRSNFGSHPGWEWPGVGLDRRVCSGLQS